MESFGERILKLRKSVGLTSEHMAKLIDVSLQRIENLETNYSQPKIEEILRLAQIFNVTPGYMAMMTDDPAAHEPDGVREVFVVKSFGEDGILRKSDLEGTVYMNRDQFHGKDFIGFTAKDDSMVKARIFKGDMLIVCRQCHADNGEVVVAMVDGGGEVVRRYQRSGNIVTLTAEGDTMKYKPLKIDVRESKLLILGVVKEVRIQNI